MPRNQWILFIPNPPDILKTSLIVVLFNGVSGRYFSSGSFNDEIYPFSTAIPTNNETIDFDAEYGLNRVCEL